MKKLHEKENEICTYLYAWFITDIGLQDWKKRQNLRKLIDEWSDIMDEIDSQKIELLKTRKHILTKG